MNLKRTSLILLFIQAILMITPVSAFASNQTSVVVTGPNIDKTGSNIMVSDILTDVQSAQSSDSVDNLTTSAKTAGNSVVTFLRVLAVIVAVVALILVGYGLFFSPNVKTLTDMKGRLGALVIGIVVAFMAEKIVGTVFMWLGIKSGG